jgi:hypothetical protein
VPPRAEPSWTGSCEICWDKADLQRRLSKSLRIAAKTVDRLGSKGYADPHNQGHNIRPEKIVSETANLLYVASVADGGDEVRALVDRVAQSLIPLARGDRALLGLCIESSLALDYGEAHLCLAGIGYPDSDFDDLLKQSTTSQVGSSRERLPHRVFQQYWLTNLWAGTNLGFRSYSKQATRSILNRPMNVLGAGRDDFYAFTHALMYLTGFGVKNTRLPRARAVVLAEAEAALARCVDEEDYDLAGELLMAWPLTAGPWSPAAVFGFRILANVEDKIGILPAPTPWSQKRHERVDDDQTDEFLAAAYHTAYVMGLLCAVALQPGRTPPTKISAPISNKGHANELLASLDMDNRNPHWRKELEQLSVAERDALTGFLLTIAIQRKVKERNFEAVFELLSGGYAKGITDTPAASQAAEMLDRLSSFATIRDKWNTKFPSIGDRPLVVTPPL